MYCLISHEIKKDFLGCFFLQSLMQQERIFFTKKKHDKLSPKSTPDLVKEHLNMLLPFLGTVRKLSESFELASPDAFKVVLNDLGKTGHLAVDFFMLMNVSAFHLSSF